MDVLLHAALNNAGWSVALALAVAAGARLWRRRPAVAHALWLLVLLKLVTPPLVPVRVLPFGQPELRPPVRVAVVEPDPEPVPVAVRPRPKVIPRPSPEEQKQLAKDMAAFMDVLIPPELKAIMPPLPPPETLAEAAPLVEDTPDEPEPIAAPTPVAQPASAPPKPTMS